MLPLHQVSTVMAAAILALRFGPFYTTPRRVVGYHKRGGPAEYCGSMGKQRRGKTLGVYLS